MKYQTSGTYQPAPQNPPNPNYGLPVGWTPEMIARYNQLKSAGLSHDEALTNTQAEANYTAPAVNNNLPTDASQAALFDSSGVNFGPNAQGSLPVMVGQNLMPGVNPNNKEHNWYMYQGTNRLKNGRFPAGSATEGFQSDFNAYQEKVRNNPELQRLITEKYDQSTLDNFLKYNLAGKNQGVDKLFGPSTTKAFNDFGSMLYDLKSQDLSNEDLANALTAQGNSGITTDTQGNIVNINAVNAGNNNAGNNSGANTGGNTSNTPISNPDPNSNYAGMTYYTDGRWTTNWDPNSQFRYSTNPTNLQGWDRVIQANNAQFGGQPQQSVIMQPAQGGNLYYQGMGANPRRLQRIANRYNRVANRMNRGPVMMMSGQTQVPMMQQGYMPGDEYYGVQAQPMQARGRSARQFINNVGNAVSAPFRQRISNEYVQDRNDRLSGIQQGIMDNRQISRDARYGVRTNDLEQAATRRLNRTGNRADYNMTRLGMDNDNLPGRIARDEDRIRERFVGKTGRLAKRYANERNRLGMNIKPEQEVIVDPTQLPPNFNTSPIIQSKQGFFMEGGFSRPKYQTSGTYKSGIDFDDMNADVSDINLGADYGKNNNYFKSNYGSGYQGRIGLAMPDEAKFTDPNYQLPSYHVKDFDDKFIEKGFNQRYIPEDRTMNVMKTSHQYGRSLANHLNNDPMGLQDSLLQGRRMGDFKNIPTTGAPGMYGMYGTYDPNMKRNMRKGLGFDASGLSAGDKMQIFGNYIPAMYNLGHAFIKPYPTMPAYNKYRYQVYNDMNKQKAARNYNPIHAMMNKGMRDLRQNAPNEQVERANRLALWNTGMDALGKQQIADDEKDRALNSQAIQQLGRIGEHELQANEAARKERIMHEEARDNIVSKGVGQFGAATGAYGRSLNNALDNKMKWELLSQIYTKYGLGAYNEIMSGLQAGTYTADDIVVFNKDGDIEKARALAEARRAAKNSVASGGKPQTSQSNTTLGDTNGGMSATETTIYE